MPIQTLVLRGVRVPALAFTKVVAYAQIFCSGRISEPKFDETVRKLARDDAPAHRSLLAGLGAHRERSVA